LNRPEGATVSVRRASDDIPAADDGSGLSVTFWGVRGTAPTSGAEHLAFGGDTMCLEVFAGERRVIIDAGSGLLGLGRALVQRNIRRADILLTHFHIDHVLGLMSFAPLFSPGAAVTIHAPILGDVPPRKLLARFLGPPLFPLRPEEAGVDFAVSEFRPGASFSAGGLEIATCALSHPGGACGYRIDHDGRRIAAVFDHEHGSPSVEAALAEFCASADLLLYDSAWDEDVDYAQHRGWGHSTWQSGLRLLRAARAGRLGCLHHSPFAADAVLFEREARLRALHPDGFFARAGRTVPARVPRPTSPGKRSS
jgi:phosphoribosyl 1,2-cyclic phosphodiesterase